MQIIRDRRALHRIPEINRELPETLNYLTESLSGLNCQVFSPVEGALCAFFDFGAQRSLAFRADMDALPIVEKNETDYVSLHPGKMHACGHDGHMAILLELARRLSRKQSNSWNILLVFQPAEETTGGAKDICQTGVFSRYGVEAIFGLHIWPGLTPGKVFSRKNELMARACQLLVDVYGKSAHIAKAGEGVDALMAGVEFYRRAMELEAALPASVYRLLKFGKFSSGTVRNALSAHTAMAGSLRAFQDDTFEYLRSSLREIGKQVDAAYGSRTVVDMNEGYPAVMNPEDLFERTAACVNFETLTDPFMTAEDFSWYQKYLPGMFFFLGLGDVPALHADTFDFDDTILEKGADFFETLAVYFK